MQSALKVLVELDEGDVNRLFSAGRERQVIANTVVTQEGSPVGSLFILLDGLLGVTVSSAPDTRIAALGPGELIGDVSFLEHSNASATVTAVESSLLLEIPRAALEAELQDTAFAARFYRSLAVLNAQRLKDRVGSLGRQIRDRDETKGGEGGAWEALSMAIDGLKKLMTNADAEALKRGSVSEETYRVAYEGMLQLMEIANRTIGDASEESPAVREKLGAQLQREIMPYLLLTNTAERFYSKPRGYAGDYFTIEMIYRNQPAGQGRLGPLIDRVLLNTASCAAVRNRRGLLAEEIARTLKSGGGSAQITSLACGPAQELFDVFQKLEDRSQLRATLIDIDPEALAFVTERRDALGRVLKLLS